MAKALDLVIYINKNPIRTAQGFWQHPIVLVFVMYNINGPLN